MNRIRLQGGVTGSRSVAPLPAVGGQILSMRDSSTIGSGIESCLPADATLERHFRVSDLQTVNPFFGPVSQTLKTLPIVQPLVNHVTHRPPCHLDLQDHSHLGSDQLICGSALSSSSPLPASRAHRATIHKGLIYYFVARCPCRHSQAYRS